MAENKLNFSFLLDKEKNEALLKIRGLILNSKKILAITHSQPDGDGLGAVLALFLALKKLKKEVVSFCVDKPSYIYEFLPSFFEIKNKINFEDFDLIIFLDCANEKLTGIYEENSFPFSKKITTVNIDHHSGNSLFGKVNLVDTTSSATCEIIFFLLKDLEVEIDKDIASCLLCGIYTDTGSFQNQNTSRRSLEIASWLLRAGGKIKELIKYAFKSKRLSTLRLWGKAMSSLFKNEKYNLVIAIITRKDMEEAGASEEDMEGIANFLNTIPEVNAVMILYDRSNGTIKGSLRTRHLSYDVFPLARALGGGGHRKAAGFVIEGSLKKTFDGWRVI